MSRVHPSAIVDPCAEMDSDVEIGSHCVIGAAVKIGKGTRVHSHAVIEGRTTLGEGNVIFPFATVGTVPQDLKYKGEPSELFIGNRNTIREYVSLNPGTTAGGMVTRVGDQNLLMMHCPPYCNATGDRAKLHGLNIEGLKRRGFDKAVIDLIRRAYRIAFSSKLRTEDALNRIRKEIPSTPEIETFVTFIAHSQRGVCR